MKVNAPNFYLFAFQAYKATNLNENDFAPQKDFLWNSADLIVSKILQQDLNLSQKININKASDGYKVDLLAEIIDDNPTVELKGEIFLDDSENNSKNNSKNNASSLPIEGFVHAISFSDSYCLSLNIGISETKDDGTAVEESDIDIFRKLNPHNCFTLQNTSTFLGQTLLITAKINNIQPNVPINFREIADEYLKKVFPDNIPPYSQQGKLFNSPIIEYGLFSQIQNYQHVLVWLFTDDEAENKFNECYSEIVDLFFYRNKVVKAFKDRRNIYQYLKKTSQEIEAEIDKLPQPEDGLYSHDENNSNNNPNNNQNNLTDLKNKLKKLPHLNLKYTRLIRNLEEYKNTITINSDNYAQRLQRILDTVSDENSNRTAQSEKIEFLKIFLEKSCPYFKDQIDADLGYFRHASTLLDRATESIRGIVEIEQAEINQRKETADKERDAKLQNTIQSVGVGLGIGTGVASIFSQTFPLIIEKKWALPSKENPLLFPHPFLISFSMSLILGIVCGWSAWRYFKQHLDNKLPSQTSSKNTLTPATPPSLTASPTPEVIAVTTDTAKQPHI